MTRTDRSGKLSTGPAFAADVYGAEYTVAAEIRAGAVVLLLTAPDQSGGAGRVASVTITAGGTGYTSAPTVTFQAAPAGGATATGAAVGPFDAVGSVTVTTAGTGYTSAPTISFTGGGGAGAAATARLTRGGNSRYENLFWALQTLYGKELLVQIVDQ